MSISDRIKRSVPIASTIASNASNILAGIGVGVIVGRYLGPVAVAQIGFAMAVAALMSMLILCGVNDVATRLYLRKDHEKEAVLGATLTMAGIGSVIAILLALAVGIFMELPRVEFTVLALITVVTIINGISNMITVAIIAYDWSAKALPSTILAQLLLVAGAWTASDQGTIIGVAVAHVVSSLVQLVWRAVVIGREGFAWPRYSADAVREIWRHSRHIAFGSLFGAISARADVLLLQYFGAQVQLGYYVNSYRVINGISQGANTACIALYPAYMRGDAENPSLARRLFILFPFVAGIGLLFSALVLADPLIYLLYGEKFAPAGPILAILLGAAIFQTSNKFIAKILVSYSAEHWLPRCQSTAAALNVGINFVVIPMYGAIGAATATLAADASLCALLYLGVRIARAKASKLAAETKQPSGAESQISSDAGQKPFAQDETTN